MFQFTPQRDSVASIIRHGGIFIRLRPFLAANEFTAVTVAFQIIAQREYNPSPNQFLRRLSLR